MQRMLSKRRVECRIPLLTVRFRFKVIKRSRREETAHVRERTQISRERFDCARLRLEYAEVGLSIFGERQVEGGRVE